MNVSSATTNQIALQGVEQLSGVDNKRAALQMALLRKVLDSQQEQAAELSRMAEGKGNVVDMRV